MTTPKAIRGLPLVFADGQEYFIPSLRLGTPGKPARDLLRQYEREMIAVAKVSGEASEATRPEAEDRADRISQFNDVLSSMQDSRHDVFVNLMIEILTENYGVEEAKRIADLLTIEMLEPALHIIRTGHYPEGFTPPRPKA